MSQTETVEDFDGVDYESFIDAAMETDSFKKQQSGFATLKSCEVIDGDDERIEGVSYIDNGHKCYLFDGQLGTGDDITVVCCANRHSADNKALRWWTDSESVGELAGEKVPVYGMSSDVYRVDAFDDGMNAITPFFVIDSMLRNGLMKFSNGYWNQTSAGELVQSALISLTVIPFLGLLLFQPVASFVYILVLIVWLMHADRENMIGFTTRY